MRINGSLTLSCLTKGFPEPKVQWFRDGQVGTNSASLEQQTCVLIEQVQPLLATSKNCSKHNKTDTLFTGNLHSPDYVQ